MKAIIGLGNPGAEYVNTRHNAGYRVVDELTRRRGWGEEREKRSTLGGQTIRYRYAQQGDRLMTVKPLTFMNASGAAVAAVIKDFGLELADVLVVLDDASLPLGKLRLKPSGSSAGQKGLEDILNVSGTDRVQRLRVGVGLEVANVRGDMAAFVLAEFAPEEKEVLGRTIALAADAAELWADKGIDEAMNRFNGTQEQES